ncbi:MAG TPA: 50S ribosomal protein L15 [Erysipelothrix sp.]|nr:50S ribosomal protein L15 [Erysipelothrix sp.]
MKLHELTPTPGARKRSKRVGRGHGSGLGKTSGRGQTGQLSRSGGGKAPGFEGGQTPIYIRLPKRGFTNRNRKEFAVVNLAQLNRFDEGVEVTVELLKAAGLVKDELNGVKILGQGKLEKALSVQAHAFSESAKAAIEQAGGKAEVV